MKRTLIVVFSVIALASGAYAADKKGQAAKPYGAQCPLCGEYGYCSKAASHEEAVKALEEYYEEKGMTVSVIKKEGRFIEADIYRDKEFIDRVLLDCRTGKIRSVY